MTLPPMQLHMILANAAAEQIPAVLPPPGYDLRPYRPGDEAGILRVLEAAGFDDWNPPRLTEYLQAPERAAGTHVVTCNETHVALTFASQETPVPRVGRLDYVAADPDHQGRGLGKAVCAAVIRYLLDRDYPSVVLSTDDWRRPAIKTYLRLGFRPKMIREDMPERWRVILEELGWDYDDDWMAYPTKER